MPRQRNGPLNTMNNQGDKASQKERKKSPENKLTDIEICNLNDREFRMVLLKKLNENRNKSYQQIQELKQQLDEQKEFFSKEIETLKRNQIELLEMKNTWQDMKNEIASLGNRDDEKEERISDIEDRNLGINQKEEERN